MSRRVKPGDDKKKKKIKLCVEIDHRERGVSNAMLPAVTALTQRALEI